jgi:hypothetical protein
MLTHGVGCSYLCLGSPEPPYSKLQFHAFCILITLSGTGQHVNKIKESTFLPMNPNKRNNPNYCMIVSLGQGSLLLIQNKVIFTKSEYSVVIFNNITDQEFIIL